MLHLQPTSLPHCFRKPDPQSASPAAGHSHTITFGIISVVSSVGWAAIRCTSRHAQIADPTQRHDEGPDGLATAPSDYKGA